MTIRRLTLACAVIMALAGGIVPNRAGGLDRTNEGKDVTVTVTSPFNTLPPSGCVPFRINIRNDLNAAGTWQFIFQGVANVSSLGATVYKQQCSVGPNTSGSFEVLVPLPVVSEDRGNTVLNIGVSGPGFDAPSNRQFAYFYTNNPGFRSPYTVIGNDVLGTIGLGPMTSYCKGLKQEFYGSDIDLANMPTDWRALSGVASLILKDNGWLSLTAAQRGAICDYVSQGGHLTLFTADNPDVKAPELQLPTFDGKPGPYGFGNISLVLSQTFPPEPSALYAAMDNKPMGGASYVDQYFSNWELRTLVGSIAVSGAFILSFVVLFGALVGPINLFVLAGGNNRFRLFWTTPLISIVACLALIVGILFTDGIGGSGKQMIAIFSMPGTNRETVIQEQVARTAVLFANRWHSDQNYLITPVSDHAINDAMAQTGRNVYRGGGVRTDLDNSPDVYRQVGNEYSGNWFRSRAVTGQYLQALRPSRASLTVMNPTGFKTRQEAPVVVSSFPQKLDKMCLIDTQGNYWVCDSLEPGHKKTCTAWTRPDFEVFWKEACGNAGGKLDSMLRQAKERPGTFYATGLPAVSETLTTLDEIRWQAVTGVYLGPWAESPTEEGKP